MIWNRKEAIRAAALAARAAGSLVAAGSLAALAFGQQTTPTPPTTQVTGVWVAHPVHNGEKGELVLQLESGADGKIAAKFSNPVLHIWELPIGPVGVEGNEVRVAALGMAMTFDSSAQR